MTISPEEAEDIAEWQAEVEATKPENWEMKAWKELMADQYCPHGMDSEYAGWCWWCALREEEEQCGTTTRV